MKKVLLFLIFCAIGYGIWYSFSKPEEPTKTEQEEATDSTLTISVKNELKEVLADSAATPNDSIEPEAK